MIDLTKEEAKALLNCMSCADHEFVCDTALNAKIAGKLEEEFPGILLETCTGFMVEKKDKDE